MVHLARDVGVGSWPDHVTAEPPDTRRRSHWPPSDKASSLGRQPIAGKYFWSATDGGSQSLAERLTAGLSGTVQV